MADLARRATRWVGTFPYILTPIPNNVFNLSATYDLDLWPKILKIFVSHGVPIRNMYAKFHNDRLRNGWDITLWNFAKTRTNTQTHKHTHKQTWALQYLALPLWGRGKYWVHKSNKEWEMEKNARNITLFRCSKALYFHTFSKMFLSKFTLKNMYNIPQICSGMLKIAPKALHFLKSPPPPPPRRTGHNPPPPPSVPSLRLLTTFIIPHFLPLFIVSLLVYISQMYLLV